MVKLLSECQECENRIEMKGVTNARHLNELVVIVAARNRHIQLKTKQDDTLAEREPLPWIAC